MTSPVPLRTLTFVRHGQSLANAGGVTMDDAAIPLTDLGLAQAAEVAELLPARPTDVFTSPFERAVRTSRPYCERVGMTGSELPILSEFSAIDPVLIAGMTGEDRRPIADAYWAAADPHKRMGTRADTFAEFATRVLEFRQSHMPALTAEVVVFGHGIWLGMLIWQLLGFPVEGAAAMKAFRKFQLGLPLKNCVVYRFHESAQGQWRIEADSGACA